MMESVIRQELELVPGRPCIYGLEYPAVNGWYIGKNETGRVDYMGSPSDATLRVIANAHNAAGLASNPTPKKHILWSPAGADRQECRNQEWIWIARFRANHDGPVFNLFPIQDWSNHFAWEHDPVTHVDRATNSRWPVVYIKMQATRDIHGNCSGGKDNRYGRQCGRPWDNGTPSGLYWCKVIYPGEREEWLYAPGPHRQKAYNSFRLHKLQMIAGDDGTPTTQHEQPL